MGRTSTTQGRTQPRPLSNGSQTRAFRGNLPFVLHVYIKPGAFFSLFGHFVRVYYGVGKVQWPHGPKVGEQIVPGMEEDGLTELALGRIFNFSILTTGSYKLPTFSLSFFSVHCFPSATRILTTLHCGSCKTRIIYASDNLETATDLLQNVSHDILCK